MSMRIRLTDADREALADWLADTVYARVPEALDARPDARRALVTRHKDGLLAYQGRVVLVLPDGVKDLTVSVRQGVVDTRPWRPHEGATLPDLTAETIPA